MVAWCVGVAWRACVEGIAGKEGHINYDAIAGIIYTNPELAGVGLTEEQEMLQQSAREFLTQECPPTFVREIYKEPDGFSRELHRKMAEQGWKFRM